MVVVGAGLAGLSAAYHLVTHGYGVTVVEASDQVGGRVRTDLVDGYRLDRGFQVFNTAYPEAARLLDLDQLDVQPFVPGALIYTRGARHLVADPRRRPGSAWSTLRAPVGSLADKVRLATFAAVDALAPSGWLKRRPDRTIASALSRAGLRGPIVEQFLQPFLAGVFLDGELNTSARVFHLVLRSFARGRLGLPAGGMGAIPTQLVNLLGGAATVRLGEPVRHVAPHEVILAGGARLSARAVVVATDPGGAAGLLPTLPPAPMRGVTTFYHLAPESPLGQPALLLDGEERLILNTAVLTDVAASYGPRAGALVSTSVLGVPDRVIEAERAVRARLAILYGTSTSSWDHVETYRIPAAVPAMLPPHGLRRSVRVSPGLYVCGDHRDTSSIQGAMVSGRRAASAVVVDLAGGGGAAGR